MSGPGGASPGGNGRTVYTVSGARPGSFTRPGGAEIPADIATRAKTASSAAGATDPVHPQRLVGMISDHHVPGVQQSAYLLVEGRPSG